MLFAIMLLKLFTATLLKKVGQLIYLFSELIFLVVSLDNICHIGVSIQKRSHLIWVKVITISDGRKSCHLIV